MGEGTPIRLGEELTIQNADELHRQLVEALESGGDVVVDLGGVETCDTAALQLICSAAKTAVARGVRFELASVSPAVETTAVDLGLSIQQFATGGDSRGL